MTFKERAVAALEEYLKGTKGVVKATIMDCLTIVKQVPELDTNTFACTGEHQEEKEAIRKTIVKLISSCACEGPGESLGSCPDRKFGQCGEVANLSYCVIQNLTNHLMAHGVTIPVRCKDCDRFCPEEIRKAYNTEKFCMRTGWVVKDDDFCSRAQKG